MTEEIIKKGTPVIVHDGHRGQPPVKCIVAGCERSRGLSIIVDEDIDDIGLTIGTEFLCLHGKDSPHRGWFEEKNPKYAENYDNAFNTLVKEIKEGVITTSILLLTGGKEHGSGGQVVCAYSG